MRHSTLASGERKPDARRTSAGLASPILHNPRKRECIRPQRKARSRDAIGEIRRDLPVPSYVLHSSPNRLHVPWRVTGFPREGVEGVAEAARPQAARLSGCAASDSTDGAGSRHAASGWRLGNQRFGSSPDATSPRYRQRWQGNAAMSTRSACGVKPPGTIQADEPHWNRTVRLHVGGASASHS